MQVTGVRRRDDVAGKRSSWQVERPSSPSCYRRSTQAPVGKVRSRSFLGAVYETEIPGAPDGKYIVIRYRATVEHKESTVETVTPMLEKDGMWRVLGYFIR